MKQDKCSPVSLICYACGCIPVIWIALLFAPYLDDGLIGLIKNAGAAFANPFHIMLCRDSLRAVLIFLLIYGLALAVFLSSDRNYRRREEHGSAQWGSPREISRKYANKAAPENKILTQTVAIGLDGRKHRTKSEYSVLRRQRCWQDALFCKTQCDECEYQLCLS